MCSFPGPLQALLVFQKEGTGKARRRAETVGEEAGGRRSAEGAGKQVAGWEQMGGAKEAEPQPPGRKDEKQCDFWKRSQEGEKLVGTGAL